MRTGSPLCSQPTEGMEPLGAFNQPVYKSYGQIRAALLNELGKPFADYFARPDLDSDATRIGWFAHELGEPRRWIDMPPEEQARLDPARQRIQDGFAQYRAQLDAAPQNSPRSNFGKLLAQASCVPGPQYLYFLGDQPVIAFWGFKTMGMPQGVDPLRLTPGSMVLSDASLLGEGEEGGKLPPLLDPMPSRRRWWLWLLLLLLLLLLLGLWAWWTHRPFLVRSLFGTRPPVEHVAIPPVPPPPIAPVAPDINRRPDVVPHEGVVVPPAGLHGVTGDTITGTVPTGNIHGRDIPVGEVPAGNGPLGDVPLGEHADHGTGLDHGVPPIVPPGSNGDLKSPGLGKPPTISPHAAIPADLPNLPPAGAPMEHGPPLGVPKNAAPGPADFMQGVWRSRSGLMLNGKPAEEYYRFDKSGQGEVTLRTRDGSTECSGPAHAVVGPDRSLNFQEASELACSDGSSVQGAATQCRQGGDRATCEGTNESDGSRFGVQIEGVRKP